MINKSYLKATDAVKSAFENNGSVELKLFMENSSYSDFRKKILAIKTRNIFEPLSRKHAISKNFKIEKEILEFVEKIIGIKPNDWQLWTFAQGEYTVINDEDLEKPGMDVIIDLTEKWDESYGGAVVYVDGTGESTKVGVEGNKLIIVQRKKGEHRFVQYVNHLAKKNKRILLIARI